MSFVLPAVVPLDERIVLRRSRLYLESVKFPVVGRTDQLSPVAYGRTPIGVIGRNLKQMGTTIGISEFCN